MEKSFNTNITALLQLSIAIKSKAISDTSAKLVFRELVDGKAQEHADWTFEQKQAYLTLVREIGDNIQEKDNVRK